MLSYCHKILLSKLKTLRSFVSYFACSHYIWSLVHSLPQRGGQQIPVIHHKKHRSVELPSSCLTAQDCVDTCVGCNSLKLGDSFLNSSCACLFPRKHLTFQNLQERLDRLLAEKSGSEDSRGRRHRVSGLCFLLVLLNWEVKLYHEKQFPE